MTPTKVSLGRLDADRLAKLDANGRLVAGDAPTKEAFLHLAIYRRRPCAQAIVHLHATRSVTVSCLEEIDSEDVLPPIAAYYVMRVGRLALVPCFPPGHPELDAAIGKLAARHAALLLANHGPVVAGDMRTAAADAMEELEETARLYLLSRGNKFRCLSLDGVAHLRAKFQ